MNEGCAACGAEYEITPENARLVMFLGYPPASHVVATCTHCRWIEVIYVSTADLVKLAAEGEGEGQFPLTLRDQPTDHRRAEADAAWAEVAASTSDQDDDLVLDLPEAPRDWMRQLHDDLREFGRRS